MCRPRSGRLRFGCIDSLKFNYVCFEVCTPEATIRYQRKRMGSKSLHIIMIHSCYPSTVAFAIQKGLHIFPLVPEGFRTALYTALHPSSRTNLPLCLLVMGLFPKTNGQSKILLWVPRPIAPSLSIDSVQPALEYKRSFIKEIFSFEL